ncbi:MAG TPA: ATP-dependent Clp protease ATP-binding subunit ClpX, partial [bacterium]|nr:ATP-dependent Clp protease ATP-binding subunit ClpX [bacterium]
PKNALIKQYRKLFELERVELDITDKALRAIAQEAIKRKTGARGLRAILENVMLEIMYKIPTSENVKKVVVTEETIFKKMEPLLIYHEAQEKDRMLRIS